MKVWEFAEALVLSSERNPIVVVNVETEEIAYKYGSIYHGDIVKFCGINGRLSDVPAYLGNCDVRQVDEEVLMSNETKYTIYL